MVTCHGLRIVEDPLERGSRMQKLAYNVLVVLALSAAGCREARSTPPDEKVPVAVATAEQKTIPIEITAIGHVEPLTTVAIRAQVSGQLQKVWFREGDDVRRGALLFTIDPRPYRNAVAQAEAALARDLALLRSSEAEAARSASLASQGLVNEQDNERRIAAAQSARATVSAGRAAVETARLQLSYCQIHSPIDGRTGGLMVHAGNLIRVNDAAPMVVINQISPIHVSFSVPQAELTAIRSRSAARVTATPPDGAPAEGVLSFIDNAVNAATGTIAMKARFANQDRSMWPGQFVKMAVNVANREHAVVVPSRAVQTGQKGPFVWVVRSDGSVEMRDVNVFSTRGAESVIERGLAPREVVVTEGQIRLTAKSKVQVKGSA